MLKRAGPNRKPLRRVSKKRARELPILAALVKKKLRRTPRCERCGRKATCVHHWAGRRWNLLKEEYLRSSCWTCNLWAKDNPAAARAVGWLAPVGVYAT